MLFLRILPFFWLNVGRAMDCPEFSEENLIKAAIHMERVIAVRQAASGPDDLPWHIISESIQLDYGLGIVKSVTSMLQSGLEVVLGKPEFENHEYQLQALYKIELSKIESVRFFYTPYI